MEDGKIALEDERDIAFCAIAQGSLVNDTRLPSGYRTPPRDMIIRGTEIVEMTKEDRARFNRRRWS